MEATRTLGLLIKTKRMEQGLSQGDVAKLLGYSSPQYISDWERGESAVPMKKLIELARHLNIDQDQLFDMLLEFATTRLAADMTAEYESLSKSRPRKRRKS